MDNKSEAKDRQSAKAGFRVNEHKLQVELDALHRKGKKEDAELDGSAALARDKSAHPDKWAKHEKWRRTLIPPEAERRLDQFESRTNPEGFRRRHGGLDPQTEKKLQTSIEKLQKKS